MPRVTMEAQWTLMVRQAAENPCACLWTLNILACELSLLSSPQTAGEEAKDVFKLQSSKKVTYQGNKCPHFVIRVLETQGNKKETFVFSSAD